MKLMQSAKHFSDRFLLRHLPTRLPAVLIGALVLIGTAHSQAARQSAHAALEQNILIADRGNNRIIEVTPDKQIVWEFDFTDRQIGHVADDAFFAPGNKQIVANLEQDQVIVVIDYETRKIVWQYGTGVKGSDNNELHTPDDAYMLPDGTISVADIDNCRIAIVSQDKKLVRQYGKTHKCLSQPGYYNKPNGATPLSDGHFLITEIVGQRVTEVDANGNDVYSFQAPLHYPSDAQRTVRGTIIIADYAKVGSIMELDTKGNILWQFGPFDDNSDKRLRWPSLAAELPNGNIIANDDFNHRVIVIDKETQEIVWQYGVTGRRGVLPGYLSIPDGLDWRHDNDPKPAATPVS